MEKLLCSRDGKEVWANVVIALREPAMTSDLVSFSCIVKTEDGDMWLAGKSLGITTLKRRL